MTTFSPKSTTPYKKTHPPQDEASRFLYTDKQFQELQKTILQLVEATQQLQQEIPLIWTALNALGQTMP